MFKYLHALIFGEKKSSSITHQQVQAQDEEITRQYISIKSINKRHKDSDEFKKSLENWVENASKRAKIVRFVDSDNLYSDYKDIDFNDVD